MEWYRFLCFVFIQHFREKFSYVGKGRLRDIPSGVNDGVNGFVTNICNSLKVFNLLRFSGLILKVKFLSHILLLFHIFVEIFFLNNIF